MPAHVKEATRRVSAVDKKMERLIQDLLFKPGLPETFSDRIDEMTAVVQSWHDLPPDTATAALERLRARVIRLQNLVESGLAFHCGALLTNPSVEYTYTPAGQMLRNADETNLDLQA